MLTLKYLSVCSGIEAATVAWHPLGWQPLAFAEIEKFPSAVLAHHYPQTPNLGDITRFKEWPNADIDLLVGGTPCQSFSVAGLRKGLDDPRGNLALTYCAILNKYHPRWFIWENVPGVLSSDGGRAFGSILGAMAELGYGFAYRVLDAQYVRVDGFGRAVPQRRRRVFVVGHLGDWRRPAAVLFERESLQGNTPPRREAGQKVAPTISARPSGGGGLGTDFDCGGGLVAKTLSASRGADCANAEDLETYIPAIVNQAMSSKWSKGSSGPAGDEVANLVAFNCKASGQSGFGVGEIASTLRAMGHANSHTNGGGHAAVAFAIQERAICENVAAGPDGMGVRDDGAAYTIEARTVPQAVATGWAVRRLTPRECERLQGFPDGYTDVPWRNKNWTPDGPRYKSLGNSMAVNAMRWLGRRIEMVRAAVGDHA